MTVLEDLVVVLSPSPCAVPPNRNVDMELDDDVLESDERTVVVTWDLAVFVTPPRVNTEVPS